MILQASLLPAGPRMFKWRAVCFVKLPPENYSCPLFHLKSLILVRRLFLFAGHSAACMADVAPCSLFGTGRTSCWTGHVQTQKHADVSQPPRRYSKPGAWGGIEYSRTQEEKKIHKRCYCWGREMWRGKEQGGRGGGEGRGSVQGSWELRKPGFMLPRFGWETRVPRLRPLSGTTVE